MHYKFDLPENSLIIINDITLLQTGLAIKTINTLCSSDSLPLSFKENLKSNFQNTHKLSTENYNTLENLLFKPDDKLCELILRDFTVNLCNSAYFKEVLYYDERDTLEFIKTNLWSQLTNIRTGKLINELMDNETSYGNFFQVFYTCARFMRQFEEMVKNVHTVLPENDPSWEIKLFEDIKQVAHLPGAYIAVLAGLCPKMPGIETLRRGSAIFTATQIFRILIIAKIVPFDATIISENRAVADNEQLRRTSFNAP